MIRLERVAHVRMYNVHHVYIRTYGIRMHTTYVQYIYVYCTSALVFHVGSPLHSCCPFVVDALVLCDGVSEWRGPDVSYSISKKIPS